MTVIDIVYTAVFIIRLHFYLLFVFLLISKIHFVFSSIIFKIGSLAHKVIKVGNNSIYYYRESFIEQYACGFNLSPVTA